MVQLMAMDERVYFAILSRFINEVEEKSVNEVVDVTIDSGAERNVWPKGEKVSGKLMPLKKKVKFVAANGSPIDVH